ncbi:lysozyme inhibitor LprI family protein [Yersinia sp. 2466 StPb PI]|uniref:lysozyme inhibitor LprI family protein n=1 Tax=Yersinia sp. 2466 StPb PI TaxID=3061648 RepID=UPI00355BB15D
MRIAYFRSILFLLAMIISSSSFAINCQRAATPVEYTVCGNEDLHWLDQTFSDIYQSMLVKYDTETVYQQRQIWEKSLNSCTSDSCIQRAYFQGIASMSDIDKKFDWAGQWWNVTKGNDRGGVIKITRVAEWGFSIDSRAWSGENTGNFRAEARKIEGLAVVDLIENTASCRLLLIPIKDGSIQVHSNGSWGCRISMPKDVFIDGQYIRAEKDPRETPSLLSVGIFTDTNNDKLFRELVGDHYAQFVASANVYIYSNDRDNREAKVLSTWVRGAANKRASIIMYNRAGLMWAAYVAPEKNGTLRVHYFTNVPEDKDKRPKTIVEWQQTFMDN